MKVSHRIFHFIASTPVIATSLTRELILPPKVQMMTYIYMLGMVDIVVISKIHIYIYICTVHIYNLQNLYLKTEEIQNGLACEIALD